MRFTRLAVLATLALALLAARPLAEARQAGKIPRIAVVISNSPVGQMLGPDPVHPHIQAFLQALRDLGYVDGRNIVIERRSAEGWFDRLPEIFAELIRLSATLSWLQPSHRPGCQAGTSSIPSSWPAAGATHRQLDSCGSRTAGRKRLGLTTVLLTSRPNSSEVAQGSGSRRLAGGDALQHPG
jgi:hypothetical protein